MRSLFAALLLILSSSNAAWAASYLRPDGSVVNPIMFTGTAGPHPCSGVDLQPGVDAAGASLPTADLTGRALANVVGLGETSGSAFYDGATDFTNAYADLAGTVLFDPVAAGCHRPRNPSRRLMRFLAPADRSGKWKSARPDRQG